MKLNNCSTSTNKSELEKYLAEETEDPESKIDILVWWKVNSNRFLVLGHLARDVLAIPITTVASESAFSIGGHILDDFRTSLTPFMLEALVCTQDWLRRPIVDIKESTKELTIIEKGIIFAYLLTFVNLLYVVLIYNYVLLLCIYRTDRRIWWQWKKKNEPSVTVGTSKSKHQAPALRPRLRLSPKLKGMSSMNEAFGMLFQHAAMPRTEPSFSLQSMEECLIATGVWRNGV